MSEATRSNDIVGPHPPSPGVTVIILNWNLWEMTITCLQSLFDSDYSNLEILVIDNGSENDSAERISEWIDGKRRGTQAESAERSRMIASKENLGYPGGNNLGIRMALEEGKAEFVLLLNNDVVVAPDAISRLVNCAVSNPDYSFIGPKILQMDSPRTIQCKGASVTGGFVLMRPLGYGEEDKTDPPGIVRVDAVYGACLLARVSHIRRIGGLDEEFRFYSEDIEWCLRARKLGFMVGCEPSAVIWHKSEASTKRLGAARRYQAGRGRALLLRKYSPAHMRVLYVFIRLPKDLGTMMHADGTPRTAVSFTRGFLQVFLRPARAASPEWRGGLEEASRWTR